MTKNDLLQAETPIPQLFAYGISADCHLVSTPASGFTYELGIPSSYSSLTGKKVCRADVNGLGRAITQSKWFNQLGGYYTFSPEVSELIGGYPEGAILYYKDPTTGYIRLVRSLIPDNTNDFVSDPSFIDDVNWSYVDNIPSSSFKPKVFVDLAEPETGTLHEGDDKTFASPCLVILQTGCDSMDCTNDDADYTMFATVKRHDGDEFFTAGVVCYLPALATPIADGIIADPRNDTAAEVLSTSFHAFNSPSPIQLYLNAGDTLKLTGNRSLPGIANESFQFWAYSLHA